jgi:TRAP-type C4-dicarboxylate transport system substrate-binding protein
LPWIKAIKEFYIPEVDKRLTAMGGEHKIVWNEAYGGTVAKVRGLLEAVQEGVAEMGYVYTIFEPANLPLHSVTFMAPFGSDDAQVICDIFLEMHQEMDELSGQWHKYNQEFIGPVAADTDYLLTKFPVNSLEDLKGRKLGAAGSISLWASGIGIVPVQGNFATHFNNIKTGVYDGLIAFSTGIYPIKLHQVAPYATKVNLGSMLIGAVTVNKDFYDSLPADVQKVLKEVGAEYGRRVAATVMNLASLFEKKMAEEGAQFSQLPASERKKWAMTMPNIAKEWVDRNEARGLPARKVLSVYMEKLRARNADLARDWDKD